jgi:hypothetical protein
VPRVLVSDTVGFIKNLPHDLVASFKSTLDEALEASLLLHVIDASDPGFERQLAVTDEVLAEIGAQDVPRILVFNKIDRVGDERRRPREAALRPLPRLHRDERAPRPTSPGCAAIRLLPAATWSRPSCSCPGRRSGCAARSSRLRGARGARRRRRPSRICTSDSALPNPIRPSSDRLFNASSSASARALAIANPVKRRP